MCVEIGGVGSVVSRVCARIVTLLPRCATARTAGGRGRWPAPTGRGGPDARTRRFDPCPIRCSLRLKVNRARRPVLFPCRSGSPSARPAGACGHRATSPRRPPPARGRVVAATAPPACQPSPWRCNSGRGCSQTCYMYTLVAGREPIWIEHVAMLTGFAIVGCTGEVD